MKRLSILIILTALLVSGLNAQVQQQATAAWITTSPEADPFLCVFGNTIDDVMLISSFLDLNGKEARYLNQREEYNPHQNIRREMERLNARFLNMHIIQRRVVEKNGQFGIEIFFMVRVFERTGGRYYLIASNDY